ncbi:bifunctional folylpolyglutamate synthase/dihydrofolate synthase [Aristophania vespae]|uniref:bifunctional folylpolyglutamate synthase/dihydrofolate synthase n=1 Tax=Aristophania vespae TaxID=2697033 RepID=UPI0023518989|nr:folylpolyglutamate synthase/dihydrofolate synthase family protein [Aristophania vespae]UMM63783.1 hypothetical protein DM15PD_07600 [Aristophania vespae]
MSVSQQRLPPSGEYRGKAGFVIARLQELHPKLIDLSLGRLEALLAKLGHPERNLPPVIHVAGTNGKGSTCANLRAIAEAAGLRVHVMTSPHLLSVTERFRLAGQFVSEEQLIETLEEIERINNGDPITVFEVLTAAGFLLFSRTPADLAIIEVGLGGRYDATNVIPAPIACIITSISLDHQAFLGDDIVTIAREKAGIIKNHVPVIIAPQEKDVLALIRSIAQEHSAPSYVLNDEITLQDLAKGISYSDPLGTLSLPLPALEGPHQNQNSALAIAALRLADLALPLSSFAAISKASWPARLQPLNGALKKMLPPEWSLILDGGHNPGAGEALAKVLKDWNDQPIHLIVGLKDSKDASGFLRPLMPYAQTIQAVAEPDQHLAMNVEAIMKSAQKAGGKALKGSTIKAALAYLTSHYATTTKARVLICGSLYLAGCALSQDGTNLH